MAECTPGITGIDLRIPTWYKYLECNDNVPIIENIDDAKRIAAGILDIVVWLAGAAAVFFIIYGGIKYITSQGVPDKVAQARQTIIYAVAGLITAIIAETAIRFIMSRFVA